MQLELNQNTELKSNNNTMAMFAIILPLFMAAIDGTIVTAILPEITASFGHTYLYPWIMSGFLLPVALIAPFIGALGDRVGIKPTIILSVLVFVSASILVANANSMQILILGRVIQGCGAGAIIVLCYSLLAIVFSVRKRAKMQGLLSGVWGISAILGPILGGALTSLFGWQSIFLINIPIGLIALIMLLKLPVLEANKSETKIDIIAQLSFVTLCFTLMMMVSSNQIEWLSIKRLIVLLVIAFVILLYRILKNTKSSPIPIEFLKQKTLISTIIMILVSSATLYSSVTIIPVILAKQGQSTASLSALITTAALGWVVGAAFCGNKLAQFGFRRFTFIGALFLLSGSLAMIPAIQTEIMVFVAGALALIGFGMGFTATSTLVYVQNMAPKEHLSVWTSSVQFLRNFGAAIGVNIFTTIQLSSQGGYQLSFIILASIIFISVFFSLMLPKTYE